MTQIAERTATDVSVELTVNRNGGVTGLSPVVAVRDGDTANSWLDFADNTFKTVGWTTRQAALTEVSAANAPGVYRLTGGLDVSAITNLPAGTEELILEYDVPGPPAVNVSETVQLVNTFLDIAQQGDLDLVQYLGAIWIDVNNGSAGAVVGTNGLPTNPVDNLADALTLSSATGLSRYVVMTGTLTLTAALTDSNVIGLSEAQINLASQNVNGSTFENIVLSGIGSGTIVARSCRLESVSGMVIRAQMCGMGGTIGLGSGESIFHQCFSAEPGTGIVTLDFVGAGRSVNVRAYSGGIQPENMVDASNIATIEFVAGRCVVDSSCTAGVLELRGPQEPPEDNSAGTAVDIAGAVFTAHMDSIVFCDLDSATDGSGTFLDPTNNETSAAQRAREIGARTFHISGALAFFTLTPADDWTNKVFLGTNGNAAGIDPNGQDASESTFHNLSFQEFASTGFAVNTNGLKFFDCFILGPLEFGTAIHVRSRFATTTGAPISLGANAEFDVLDSTQQRPTSIGQPLFVDFQGNTARMINQRYGGRTVLRNMTVAGALAEIASAQADVVIEANCTAGQTKLIGNGRVDDRSAAGHTVDRVGFNPNAEVVINSSLDGNGDFHVMVFLLRGARRVTAGLVSATITIRNDDNTSVTPAAVVAFNTDGAAIFAAVTPSVAVAAGETYSIVASIEDADGVVSGHQRGVAGA